MATNIDKFLEPSELGSGNVPIGGIILWQNPALATLNPTPPTGFEYCDGTAVTTPGPMNGQTKANLMITAAGGTRGITRGADVNGAGYGSGTALVTGGADTHGHTGGTDSQGNHSHTVNSHTHTFTTNSTGAHTHTLPVGSGQITFNPGMPVGRLATTDSQGTHSHTGTTASSAPGTNSAGSHSHGLSINAASSLPRYVELAYIVRVA